MKQSFRINIYFILFSIFIFVKCPSDLPIAVNSERNKRELLISSLFVEMPYTNPTFVFINPTRTDAPSIFLSQILLLCYLKNENQHLKDQNTLHYQQHQLVLFAFKITWLMKNFQLFAETHKDRHFQLKKCQHFSTLYGIYLLLSLPNILLLFQLGISF